MPTSATIPALSPMLLPALPEKPLVSVLLANYNYAGFISTSIESVLSQTYEHWELIICDDGSTDQSLAVIDRYALGDKRMKVLKKANGGHTSALNDAFAESSGSIICLLDSDDLYLPGKLDAVVESFREDASAGIALDRIIRIDERGHRQGVWPLHDCPDGWVAPDVLRAGGMLTGSPPTVGISLRRELAEALFPISMQSPLDTCPDQVIMRLAPLLTSIKRIPAAQSEFRMHSRNTYTQQKVSVEVVSKQLRVATALWQAQQRCLHQIDPALVPQLAPPENSSYTTLLRYIEAKLTADPNTPKIHQAHVETCKRLGEVRSLAFWQMSIYLPNFLFKPAVRLVTGQGAIKQLIARLRQLA